MFQESNYEVTEFSIPVNGMNQFISPDILPPNFCYLLENIIPSPIGVGQSRYGTSLTKSLPNIEHDIIRCFPFVKDGEINQGILYIGSYTIDGTTAVRVAVSRSSITFTSDNAVNYKKDTKVKIVYTFNTVVYTLYSNLKNVVLSEGNAVALTIENNLLPDPGSGALVVTQIWCQFGSIYSYDFTNDVLSDPLKENLSIGCVPRCTYIDQVMLICNGVNNIMYWNGTDLKDVAEFIVEIFSNNFTRLLDTVISFTKTDGFNAEKYFIGNSIKITVNGVSTILTISNIVIVANLVTITTIQALPAFVGADEVKLFYQDKPPAFSYIYAAKDRLWALGPGAVSLKYRDKNEQLRVYYSDQVNPSPELNYGFFNQDTRTVPSIDISDKHVIQDNLEAICQVNGFMAFIGKKRTQVWSGYTPGIAGDFSWNSNLSVGIFHGDLLLELANDTYFVSESGINSFGTLNVARQFSASSEDAVNTIVKKFTSDAISSNYNYRKCTSFKYNGGNIAGFKISNNKILASLFTTRLYSWLYLSGDFSRANCFSDLDEKLYICIGNKIFKYADGNDGSQKIYGDQDGASLITVMWTPGLIKFKTKKGYANKSYELVINYPSSFVLNNSNTVGISILGDTPKSFKLNDKCEFEYKGDLFGDEPLLEHRGLPGDPGFRLRKEFEVVNKRLKFVSSSFWISILGYVKNGPIIFRRIKLFGIGERNG